jgi:hypothetical protein
MNLPDNILKSKPLQALALLITLSVGLFKLLGGAFPGYTQILAFGFLFLALGYIILIVVVNEHRWRKEVMRLLEAKASEEQTAYELMSRRYGFGYELLEVDCNIFDQGNVRIEHGYDIVARSRIAHLDSYLVLEPDGPGSVKVHPKIGAFPSEKQMQLVPDSTTPNKSVISVELSDPLTDGERIAYTVIQEIDYPFFGQESDDFDYFGWSVNRPTKRMVLSLVFPQTMRPVDYETEVLIAAVATEIKLKRQNLQEKLRIGEPKVEQIEGGRLFKLRLEIDYPMVGLIYIFRWRSSSAAARATPAKHDNDHPG